MNGKVEISSCTQIHQIVLIYILHYTSLNSSTVPYELDGGSNGGEKAPEVESEHGRKKSANGGSNIRDGHSTHNYKILMVLRWTCYR